MNIKNESMEAIQAGLASESNNNRSRVKPVILAVMALWFGTVLLLGAQGAFAGTPGSPPLPIFFGFATPLAAFFTAYLSSNAFRAFILRADLRFVAAIQAWRWAGLGFVSLYAHGILPGLFALPAGLGDMAIGFTAPWMVTRLARNPSFAGSRQFVTWNIMGIHDLIVAVSMGVISSGILKGLTGNVTSGAMTQLPLVLIPAYMVPFFIMLHFAALAQARQLIRSKKSALNQSDAV